MSRGLAYPVALLIHMIPYMQTPNGQSSRRICDGGKANSSAPKDSQPILAPARDEAELELALYYGQQV
jgi:hypothetical protein